MWGILAKLVLFNKMQPSEVRRLFGTDGLKSFRTIETNTLNSDSGLNLGRLAELTGFSRRELMASFPNELSTTPSTNIPGANLGTFSRRLRLCSRCISVGIHLALHQCEGIARCPIHCAPLRAECAQCNAPTSLYWAKYIAPFPYHCHKCGASMWSHEATGSWGIALLEERQRLVEELRVWMHDIEEALLVRAQNSGSSIVSSRQKALIPPRSPRLFPARNGSAIVWKCRWQGSTRSDVGGERRLQPAAGISLIAARFVAVSLCQREGRHFSPSGFIRGYGEKYGRLTTGFGTDI